MKINEFGMTKIMVEKQTKVPTGKNAPKQHERKPVAKAADSPLEPAVDRPGFDLGGSTDKTTAGTGLGLGQDASENRRDRSLPGRRVKRT